MDIYFIYLFYFISFANFRMDTWFWSLPFFRLKLNSLYKINISLTQTLEKCFLLVKNTPILYFNTVAAEYDSKLWFGEAKVALQNGICDSLFKTRLFFWQLLSCQLNTSIGSALLSKNYWCHVTLNLYKLGTSLRPRVGVSPDSVCLRGS